MTELNAIKDELRSVVETFIKDPSLDRLRGLHDAAWNLHDAANNADLVEIMAAPHVPSAPGWAMSAVKQRR